MGLQNAKKPQLNSMEPHFFKQKNVHRFYYGKNHGLGVVNFNHIFCGWSFFQMPSFCFQFSKGKKSEKPPPLQGLEIDDRPHRVLTHPHQATWRRWSQDCPGWFGATCQGRPRVLTLLVAFFFHSGMLTEIPCFGWSTSFLPEKVCVFFSVGFQWILGGEKTASRNRNVQQSVCSMDRWIQVDDMLFVIYDTVDGNQKSQGQPPGMLSEPCKYCDKTTISTISTGYINWLTRISEASTRMIFWYSIRRPSVCKSEQLSLYICTYP